jgi:hypothetical protein
MVLAAFGGSVRNFFSSPAQKVGWTSPTGESLDRWAVPTPPGAIPPHHFPPYVDVFSTTATSR